MSGGPRHGAGAARRARAAHLAARATVALAAPGAPAWTVAQVAPPARAPGTPARPERPAGAAGDTVAVALPPDSAGAGLLAAAAARPRLARVRDLGPGPAGRLLRDVLARRHVLVVAPDTGLTLGRDVRATGPLVVVGGPVRVAATVPGDVVVLGELYLRPGADIAGRAVAIGGGAYSSTLARVGGGVLAYRDVAFAAAPDGAGGLALSARAGARGDVPRLTVPGFYGFRLPTYDRVNGLSLAAGPELALDTGRVRLELVATYRSHLGAVDGALRGVADLTRRTQVELRLERGTLSNDAWARGDFVNSIVFGGTGQDARNYYRADRGGATVARRYELGGTVLEPLVGALVERSWSAARDSAAARPFTVIGRDDARQGARRPNPAVTGGRIASALVGARLQRESEGVLGQAEARLEQAVSVERGGRFTRVNVDASLRKGTAETRQWYVFAHAALIAGSRVPSQRYAYLGGGPTLPTRFLLDQGGTELVWGEARYSVPVRRLRVPQFGPPRVTARAMAGAAGVGRLPAFTPNLGLRLSVGPLRGDAVFDPTGRTRGPQFSVGVGLR